MENRKIKILFFIGSLSTGGKERRLLELMTYLNKLGRFDLFLVTKPMDVMFENFYKLQVKKISMSSNKLNIGSFLEFYKIVKEIRPDFIHTWGNKQTLVSLPSRLLLKDVKIVNSQITSAPPKLPWSDKVISKINFKFSDIILSNSFAGLESFKPPVNKSKVIYNGLNFNRFNDLPDKEIVKKKFGMIYPFTIVMVATYSANKDYIKFFKVGIALSKLRNDTMFLGVGYSYQESKEYFDSCVRLTQNYPNLIPSPGIKDVEALVNACDIGVLFSPNGEGLSNSILEYMALGKPVVANDAGGTKEIVRDQWNGLLVQDESPEEIAQKINLLLDNPNRMREMGHRSKERIMTEFSLEKMGKEFVKVFDSITN